MDGKVVLLVGGSGYIGSHTALALSEAGYSVVVLDDHSNSWPEIQDRIANLAVGPVEFIAGDVRDSGLLDSIFARRRILAVVHLAASKSIGDSLVNPLACYDNNVLGTLRLLQAMERANVSSLVFSSSAAIYGPAARSPVDEHFIPQCENPYGRSKWIMEMVIADALGGRGCYTCLRYFNPVGAHDSGLIGEWPRLPASNLMPMICQSASFGTPLQVYGSDYPTRDGTGVRDFIHVVDLAEAHVAAVNAVLSGNCRSVLNLGTGRGVTVLELIQTFERANATTVPILFAPRRGGDIAELYADPRLAQRVLGWKARRGLESMCVDAWRWERKKPAFR